jgi:hypothetical protein
MLGALLGEHLLEVLEERLPVRPRLRGKVRAYS